MSDYIRACAKAKEILGAEHVREFSSVSEDLILNSYGDNRGEFAFLALPKDNAEIIGLLAIAREFSMSIVAQGGNTGRCDGATPSGSGNIILNMSRMNRILSLDKFSNIIQVESGCILEDIKDAALSGDRFFPLGLGSQSSCTIGGNIATNAGGINTVRYGNCREQVLGLEVILSNGDIWDGMRLLRKDNSGYDLKHLFIGSEGTLGVITRASLRLYPLARALTTAMIPVSDLRQVLCLYSCISEIFGDSIIAFEIVPRIAQEFVTEHSNYRLPLPNMSDWVIIFQAEHGSEKEAELVQIPFADMLERAGIRDPLLAMNEQQRKSIWQLRELTTAVQSKAGLSLKHDISLPIASIPEFYDEARLLLEPLCSGVRIYAYGHLGDGNLHYNLTVPEGMEDGEFAKYKEKLSTCIYDLVAKFDGSFSAEHGVGRTKTKLLRHYKSAIEWNMQRKLKTFFDPENIFNRGAIFDE